MRSGPDEKERTGAASHEPLDTTMCNHIYEQTF